MNFSVLELGILYSTASALLWAVAVVLFRRTGDHVAPLALNLFKGTAGLLAFLVTLPLVGVPFVPDDRSAADWLILAGSGVIGIGLADTLFFASLNRLGAGRSAIVDCLYSPFVVLGSALFLHEPIGPFLLLAMALMAGAILVGAWQAEPRRAPADRRTTHVGVLMGIASMALMATGIVLAKPVLTVSNPWWAATVRLAGGVAFLALHATLPGERAAVLRAFRPGRHWRLLVPASVVGGYVAMILWVTGMSYTHTTIAAILNQMSSVFVLLFAALFLAEPLTRRKGLAIAMGFAGGVLVAL